MVILKPTYIEAISTLTPPVSVTSIGDGSDYDSIIWQGGGQIPPQADLDLLVIELIKVRQWKAIQEIRDTKKGGGVRAGEHWYHSDETSRIQQLGLVMFGANLPPNIMWKTMGGAFTPMTPTLAKDIFIAVAMSDQRIFAVAEQKKAAMLASPDPLNYNFETGWPLVYGE
jgi:hypothetical protein